MAAMAASVAAVSERRVEVFVSMGALACFKRERAPDALQASEFSQLMAAHGTPDPLSLLKDAKTLGELNISACAMAMDVAALELEDLDPELIDRLGGLTKFLSDAEAGQLVVF